MMATWLDLLNYKQCVVRSDGAKFVDGERDDNIDTSWLTLSPEVTLGPGLYDELMILPRLATEEEIRAWAQAQAPWHDPSPAIDAGAQNIQAKGTGGAIELDAQGIRALRHSDNKQVLHFDSNTGNLSIAGDLTGSAGDFAGGRVRIGDVGGKLWGDGRLPSGTIGLWGDGAGLYLRGYANTILVGYAQDEEIIDVSAYSPANPQVLVAPKMMLTYWPQQPTAVPVIFTDAVMEEAGKFAVKAKTMIQGASTSWSLSPSTGDSVEGTWQQPRTAAPNGKWGVQTSFITCRVNWFASSGHSIKVWQFVTNEYRSDGRPINWVRKRYFSHTGPVFGAHSGVLDWDLALPDDQWAIRVVWRGVKAPIGIIYCECHMQKAGYRTTTFLDVNGNAIGANDPSGMDVMFYVFDRG